MAAILQPSKQDLVGERLLDVLLDHAGHRPRAHEFVVAAGDQPARRFLGQLDGDIAVAKLGLKLQHELLDHLRDDFLRQMAEGNDRVEAIAEFRREHSVDRLGILAFPLATGEAESRLGHVGRTGIGGHDQDDVAEVDLLAVVIGQLAVIHDLQQHVEQIGMRLLDFVEQQHAMRMLVDAVGQQTALVETDIAGRRADQARDRVPLHVFRHVEADQFDAERQRQLLGDFGLADAGRS